MPALYRLFSPSHVILDIISQSRHFLDIADKESEPPTAFAKSVKLWSEAPFDPVYFLPLWVASLSKVGVFVFVV